jgi:hypothetical protein
MIKPTPYAILDGLTDDQLDTLLTLNPDELNTMLTAIVYNRVARRLWENAEAKCEARNPNAGGRCQRTTTNTNHLCDHHQEWKP